MTNSNICGQAVTEYLLVMSLIIVALLLPIRFEEDGARGISLAEYFNQSLKENMQAWEYASALAD